MFAPEAKRVAAGQYRRPPPLSRTPHRPSPDASIGECVCLGASDRVVDHPDGRAAVTRLYRERSPTPTGGHAGPEGVFSRNQQTRKDLRLLEIYCTKSVCGSSQTAAVHRL